VSNEGRGTRPGPRSFFGGILAKMTRRPPLLRSLLVAALLAGGLLVAPSAALAGPESDIPGIPLPAPVVSGQLGGPIYDVVYRLDVPAGYVIVAGLSGTAGTDFDLYLFDASATTVVSNTGLLTKSIGPTSSEQLSWPTRIGGTFYLDLNGASDVEGTYTLSVQVVPDPTPPTAVLLVAGGASRVNTPAITLQLLAFDDLSGVTEMSLSADGLNFLPPVPFQTQFPWNLSGGDGPKTVWARVYNGVGLASAPVSVTVVLDTSGPTIVTRDPADGTTVTDARPPISVTFDEPIDPASWANLGLVVQAPSGGIVPGSYAYYPATRTGTFTPSADLAPGYVYIVTVGDVRDLAGNRVRDTGSWTLKRLLATSVTLAATPRVVVYGRSVGLAGEASLPPGESATLEARPAGAEAYAVDPTVGPLAGAWSAVVVPRSNTWYRVSYPGSATAIASSAEVRVLVRRAVVLLGPGPATTRSAVAGKPVTLAAQVTPAGVARVSFQLYRYDPARRTWRYAGSFGRTTDATGRATLTWTPSAGRFYWRVAVLSTAEYANNITPAYRWSVRG